MKSFIVTTLTLVAITLSASAAKVAKIDVMLLTGKSDKHHNWEVMSKGVEQILQRNESFEVEVVKFTDTDSFKPKFKGYDVIIMNLNDVTWNEKTKLKFEKYVKCGGGVVIIHEADNAFADWEEYNRIIGLGGWGGRTKESGPYYYYKDGEMVRDSISDGRSGHHGRAGNFTITVRDPEHPIMKGLPASWLHYQDELYGDMRGPALEMEVLATAFSQKATGGTGKEEPVLFTVKYGKGRTFHSVLGHTSAKNGVISGGSIENDGFQTTLLRGVEWAATGEVSSNL
ncbi:MAG: ThuA domain-containing protein [Rikenellaceae bacterium]